MAAETRCVGGERGGKERDSADACELDGECDKERKRGKKERKERGRGEREKERKE